MSSPISSTHPGPTIIAHRGVSGVYPENSLAAFRAAVESSEHRADGIELDIHMTQDGDFLVHHDPCLPDGTAIATASLARLQRHRLADGTPPPALREVLAVAVGLVVYVEVKGLGRNGAPVLLAQLAEAPGPTEVQVHAFDHRIIRRLHTLDPQRRYGVLSSSYPVDPVGPVLAAGARVLWQEATLIDRELMERCGDADIDVIAWTVNHEDLATELRALGVAGLCGNWPARLRLRSPR